jgi:1,2-diacylglycerol 3-alpha-glucosyltransferase
MKRVCSSLHRFLNNCTIILASTVLIVIIAVIATGMRVHIAGFPEFLGNSPENVAHIKTTADPNEFTFVVVGDVKCGTATFEEMLNIIQQDKPVFAVILGDFVEHSEFASHKLFALEMAEYLKDFPILLVPGNHDISTDGPFRLEDFGNIYGPSQFYFTIGKNLFVFLNDISPYNQTGQYLEFLERAVSGHTENVEKIFVFMHIPPSGLNSSLMCNGLPGSEKFLQLTKKHHIDYVFAGDHHGYVKTERDGTTFVVTGGGGARLRGRHGGFHHLVRMSVKDSEITETVVVAKRQLENAT